jgi:hypothetical protein
MGQLGHDGIGLKKIMKHNKSAKRKGTCYPFRAFVIEFEAS